MKKLNIGLIQQHNTADIADNIKRLSEGIRELAAKGAQLIVLQELHNSLYFCQEENVDMFNLAEPIPGPSTELFGKLAKELGVVIVTSLFERRAAGLYHNTAVVIESDGTIAGKYRKMHIPDDPAYYEKFYFTPGDLGFKPINTSVGRLGILVCWDQWYPEAARLMALQGAEILIYPTAIGYADSDTDEEQQRQRRAWQLVQRGHAVANGLPVVAVNRVGNEELRMKNEELRRVDEHMRIMKNAKPMSTPENLESSINFWGTSFVAGAQGELLYEASGEDEERAIVTLDMERSEQVRRWWPFLRDRRIDEYKDITKRYID
jgi:N-carbamoylputrescine amidase